MEEVSLLTKKGYLTISLTNNKEGRILLRRHEGIREWFNTLKVGLTRPWPYFSTYSEGFLF